MKLIWSWIVAFGRFWYQFIVGDDWTVAAAVGAGLLATALLNAGGIAAWWLMPILVVVTVGVSLRRASPHAGGRGSPQKEPSVNPAS
jgi:hypothetical protein